MNSENCDVVSHPVPGPTPDGAHCYHEGKSGHDVVTFTLDANWALDRRSFSRGLTSVKVSWGRSLLRVKGVVYFRGEPNPFAIQGVQHVFQLPTPLWHLTEDGFHSRLMFIAKGAVAEEIKPGWRMLVRDAAPTGRGHLCS
jgi:G3E family GTPase